MWKNVPVWGLREGALPSRGSRWRNNCVGSRQRKGTRAQEKTRRGPLTGFWTPGRRANPPSWSPPLQNSLVHLNKLSAQTVSKGWEIHPAAAFSSLSPAGQAPRREACIMFLNFLETRLPAVKIAEPVAPMQTGGVVKISIEKPKKKKKIESPYRLYLAKILKNKTKQKPRATCEFLNDSGWGHCWVLLILVAIVRREAQQRLNILKEMWLNSHPHEECMNPSIHK